MRALKRFDEQFLLRELSRLSSLAKFPSTGLAGWTHEMVDAVVDDMLLMLDEACVSEEHVSQTIADWKYANAFFPTEHELREQAWSIRQRFEPAFRVHEEKAPPMAMTPELAAAWQQACAKVDKDKEMWAAIKRELKVAEFSKVGWIAIAHAKQRLGYPLNEGDRRALEPTREHPPSWKDQRPNGEPLPPLPPKVISAADFDQARREYEKKKSSSSE